MPELKEADKVALTAIMNAALKTQAEERAASNVEVLEKMSSAMLGQQDMLIQSQTDALEKIKSLPGANVTKKLEMGSADEGMPVPCTWRKVYGLESHARGKDVWVRVPCTCT
jgi:hypothetical protein